MKTSLLTLLLFLALNVKSQDVHSELIGSFQDLSEKSLVINSIVEIDDVFYNVVINSGMKIRGGSSISIESINISAFSGSKENKLGPKITYPKIEGSLLSFVRLDSNPALITYSYDKESFDFKMFLYLIDPESLQIIDRQEIFEMSLEKIPTMTQCVSPDYSKLGVSISTAESTLLVAYGSNAKRIWEREVEGFVQFNAINNMRNRTLIDNSGNMYISAFTTVGSSHYIFHNPSHLIYVSEDGKSEWTEEIPSPEGFYIYYNIELVDNGIVCAGFYASNSLGMYKYNELKGVASVLFTSESKQFKDYNEQSIAAELMVSGYKPKTQKVDLRRIGKGFSSDRLMFSGEQLVAGNNSIYLLCEQIYEEYGGEYGNRLTRHNNDIVYVTLETNGEITKVNKITKRQNGVGLKPYGESYSCGLLNESLIILFNDQEANPIAVNSLEPIKEYKSSKTSQAKPVIVKITPDGKASKSALNDDILQLAQLNSYVFGPDNTLFFFAEDEKLSLFQCKGD